MTEFENIKLRQIDKALRDRELIPIDKLGQRIKDIRGVLGMSQAQMAKRLKIKQPTLSRIEENMGNSKLKTVLTVSRALDCEFMGVIVSKRPLRRMIRERAEKLAKKILERTASNMAMEKQAPDKGSYNYQLKKLVSEFMAKPGPELWED